MPLQLKDRALQRKLDELSDGEFTYRLQDCDFNGEVYEVGFVKSYSCPSFKFFAYFEQDEVEEFTKDKPSEWIDDSKCTPPKNVPMQLEVRTITDDILCYGAYWDGSNWRDFNDQLLIVPIMEGNHKNIRYKKWNN